MPEALDHIVFVLDRPQNLGNVGAVVRLMGNFGLSTLRLVEPAAYDRERLLTIARRGTAVLDATTRFPTLSEALADCGFIVATTSRHRQIGRPQLTPRQAALAMLVPAVAGSGPQGFRAAVVFGGESAGLTHAALDRSHAILRIPTMPQDASLNLAQAALLVAYELFQLASASGADAPERPPIAGWGLRVTDGEPAHAKQIDALIDAFARMVDSLHGGRQPARTRALSQRVRAMLLRAVPQSAEIAPLIQIFEHAARREARGMSLHDQGIE